VVGGGVAAGVPGPQLLDRRAGGTRAGQLGAGQLTAGQPRPVPGLRPGLPDLREHPGGVGDRVTAARITRGQRKVFLRLAEHWPWALALAGAFRRLRQIPLPA